MIRVKNLAKVFLVTGFLVGCDNGPSFNPTAPTPVVQGSNSSSSINVSMAAVQNCGNPNDWLPDDDHLQACLDRGGRIELQYGEPGYIVNRGVILERPGTVLTSAGSNMAKIIAGPDLFDAILQTLPHRSVDNFSIDRISFDGKVDDLVGGVPYRKLRDNCGSRGAPGNIMLRGSNFGFTNNESKNAMCGTGLGLYGSFNVQHNLIASNGRDAFSGAPGWPWADGMTVLFCDGGYIAHNRFVDNTDIDLVIGGGRGCVVELNTIQHVAKYAFSGLNIGNFQSPSAGNHAGSEYRGNLIISSAADKLSMGISIGSHMWDTRVDVFHAGTVVANTSRGSAINLVVDGVFGGEISSNTLQDPTESANSSCGRSGKNYTVNESHVRNTVLQPGWENFPYDNGLCTFGNAASRFNLTR